MSTNTYRYKVPPNNELEEDLFNACYPLVFNYIKNELFSRSVKIESMIQVKELALKLTRDLLEKGGTIQSVVSQIDDVAKSGNFEFLEA